MKILILSHAQYITVALPKIIEFAEALTELGHEITLVATHRTNKIETERFTKNGVEYLLSPSVLPGNLRHGADFYDAFRRIRLLKNKNFDIIHAIDSRPSVILPALYLKKRKDIPLILEWSDWFGKGGTIEERSSKLYSTTIGRIESYFEVSFRMKADGATVISQLLRQRLTAMGFDDSKVIMHRMGGKLERFDCYDKNTSRDLLQINKSDLVYSYFGRILPNDHKFILESFEKFRLQLGKPAHLYFIGNVKAISAGTPTHIHYKGLVSDEDYNLYLSATDACLLPLKLTLANKARWPSKFVDYLAAGKPIVATPVSDFKEIFKASDIGLLSESDSPEEFADLLLEMTRRKANWQQMGTNGRNYAASYLSWNIIAKRIVNFYRKIID